MVGNGSDSWQGAVGAGAAAGVLATAPMTAGMIAMHRFLPADERYPLPPRLITTHLLGGRWGMSETVEGVDAEELTALTLASHFAYGGACGALFPLVERGVPLPRPVTAVAFGLGVWAGSYLVGLPALGILKPATEHPPRRVALMVAAHVIWGLSLGATLKLFEHFSDSGDPAI